MLIVAVYPSRLLCSCLECLLNLHGEDFFHLVSLDWRNSNLTSIFLSVILCLGCATLLASGAVPFYTSISRPTTVSPLPHIPDSTVMKEDSNNHEAEFVALAASLSLPFVVGKQSRLSVRSIYKNPQTSHWFQPTCSWRTQSTWTCSYRSSSLFRSSSSRPPLAPSAGLFLLPPMRACPSLPRGRSSPRRPQSTWNTRLMTLRRTMGSSPGTKGAFITRPTTPRRTLTRTPRG